MALSYFLSNKKANIHQKSPQRETPSAKALSRSREFYSWTQQTAHTCVEAINDS